MKQLLNESFPSWLTIKFLELGKSLQCLLSPVSISTMLLFKGITFIGESNTLQAS